VRKAVVFVLIAFAIVLAGAQLQGALSGIISALFPAKTVAQVSASIERCDFMAGRIEPVKSLASIGRDITHVQKIADELAKEIVSAIGPTQNGFAVSLQFGDHTLHASRPVPIAVIVVTSPMAKSQTTSGFLATSTRNIRDPCLTRNSRPTHAKSVTRIHKRLAFLVHTNALTSTSCKRTILLPWVSTKGIAGSRMKGLQRTCASARYTRLIVLPRFLCVWLRNSQAHVSIAQ